MTLYKRLPWGTAKEWREWRRTNRRQYPIQWFFRETLYYAIAHRWRWWIADPWYWLKCRTWHRYNVVVCRSLPPTWNDRDRVLLHAAFQCLADFIEKEKPWEFSATQEAVAEAYDEVYDTAYGPVDTRRSCAWETIKQLYYWWEVRKGKYEKDEYDDAMLHRLIEVRHLMWT